MVPSILVTVNTVGYTIYQIADARSDLRVVFVEWSRKKEKTLLTINMSQATIQEIEFAPGQFITLETGRLAKQANGAVVARMGDTMVLATAVMAPEPRKRIPGISSH